MKPFSIFSLSLILSGVTKANFTWDWTESIGTCQNYCYAAKCGRIGHRRFTYDRNAKARQGCWTGSGCSRNPCNNKDLKFWKFENLSEFPFASVEEGGRNAHLRCVNNNENRSEFCFCSWPLQRPRLMDADDSELQSRITRRAWVDEMSFSLARYWQS